jgi:hypothetical protein
MTGVYGLSFVLVLVNATLADLAVDAWRRRLDPARAALRLGGAALPALAALLYGLAVLRMAAAEELRGGDVTGVAVVQGHLGLAERWHRHFHGRNLAKYLELTHEPKGRRRSRGLAQAAMTFPGGPSYRQAWPGARLGGQLIAGIRARGRRDGLLQQRLPALRAGRATGALRQAAPAPLGGVHPPRDFRGRARPLRTLPRLRPRRTGRPPPHAGRAGRGAALQRGGAARGGPRAGAGRRRLPGEPGQRQLVARPALLGPVVRHHLRATEQRRMGAPRPQGRR